MAMSMRAPAQAQGPAASGDYGRRWFAAAAMMSAVLMDLVDVTIVNVALPTIRHDLGASATQLEWVVSAYMLAFAAALIIAGSLGDLFGRKRLFLAGIAVFGLASLSAGLSRTAGELIAARVVQGVAAAVMTPQLLATFRTMFTGRERGQAFGIYGAVLGFASAVGLLLGGVLTSANLFGWGWRSVFFVNLPIALASLVASARLMPENRERSVGRVDFAGATLLAGALVAITYPLLEGRSLGWPAWCWALLGAGLVGLGLLGLMEMRRQHTRVAPLLRTGLFRIPAFTTGLIVQLAFAAGLQGFFLIFTLWVQTGQHYSPLRAGLTAVAFSVGSFVLAPQAAPLAQRFGRLVLALGGLLFAAGIIGVDAGAHHVGTGTNPWPLVPGLIVAGAGLSLLVIPLVNVVLAAVPAEVAGGASGLFSTAQQLGGAIGVAAAGTIFFADLGRHSFQAAFEHTAPYAAGALLICAILAFTLPRTAVADDGV
jgi:EmrB/QacA subfamily drug resistance transporter